MTTTEIIQATPYFQASDCKEVFLSPSVLPLIENAIEFMNLGWDYQTWESKTFAGTGAKQIVKEIYEVRSSRQFIQAEDVEAIIVNGYEANFDEDNGTVYFANKDLDQMIFATPNWESEGKTPIAIYDAKGNELSGVYDVEGLDMTSLKGRIFDQATEYLFAIDAVMKKLGWQVIPVKRRS